MKYRFLIGLIILSLLATFSFGIGDNLNLSFSVQPVQYDPLIYRDECTRITIDDFSNPGAISNGGEVLIERQNNYAFQGEQITWDALVYDKNGMPASSVIVELQNSTGNFSLATCVLNSTRTMLYACNNASKPLQFYDGSNLLVWNDTTMDWYKCTFTVPSDMHGNYTVKTRVTGSNSGSAVTSQNENWFFNPVIALGYNGNIVFPSAAPGSVIKSSSLTVANAAEPGSGVMLDMYIAGDDFESTGGGVCPTTNQLSLTNFRYYAVSGSYNTCNNVNSDFECYDTIPYYNSGMPNNNMKRIINQTTSLMLDEYPLGNVLSPGSEMTLTFKLNVPIPCTGGPYSQGSIMLYGEAI